METCERRGIFCSKCFQKEIAVAMVRCHAGGSCLSRRVYGGTAKSLGKHLGSIARASKRVSLPDSGGEGYEKAAHRGNVARIGRVGLGARYHEGDSSQA